MDRDDVLWLARKAGIEYVEAKGYCVHAAALHKFAAIIRAEVLEEAALICVRQIPRAVTVYECVDAIRAAKEGS